ncbi:MAG: TPM domain-containing protein [Proteobacteria bacterium]|nr:TPM domain-containing protein [Pseudomonadota bacterium]
MLDVIFTLKKRLNISMQKILFNTLICISVSCLISCSNDTNNLPFFSYINSPRPSNETRIFDNANLIKYKNSLDSHLNTLYRLADIDMVVVTLPSLQGNDISDISAKLLTNWKIGENTNGLKGIQQFSVNVIFGHQF